MIEANETNEPEKTGSERFVEKGLFSEWETEMLKEVANSIEQYAAQHYQLRRKTPSFMAGI